VVFGLVIELFTRLGIGNALASVVGFGTLLIAHYLALDGDTFTVLQAVLDTQFWLATHVVCITLGYTTTFFAGLLALLYVAGGVLTRSLTPTLAKDLARMIYILGGVVSPALGLRLGQLGGQQVTLSQLLGKLIYGVICFALIFSFVGTVLGGLWADDSWGRFWGWDPKENGALMIVIWNAIVLHARWGGMVKDRGLAVLSLGGNIVTAWSWFAVNELGIGLHSYGFTEGVMLALVMFWATQFVLIIVGCLPKSWGWSFSTPEGGAGQGGAT
jgi:ABC-type transport system involved in cytochrome c biogenesis permease subunit